MLALIPILLVLIICLRTKNIYFSLMIGILTGLLIHARFNILTTLNNLINVFAQNVSENMNMILFVAFLGIFVHLISISGVSQYFATRAIIKLKTKRQTVLVSMALGILCFIDDYFNCLTVNTVMKPIADKNGMSREKLAYIVDATAAPVCELVPISSWAGLVGASLPALSNLNGFSLYIKTIPINFYPILTLLFISLLAYLNFDFGRMKKLEDKASKKKVSESKIKNELKVTNPNARIKDLILPIVFMSVVTVFFMLWTGGFFTHYNISEAFMNCEAVNSCVAGSLIALGFMALLYLPRKVITFKQYLDGLTDGFEYISTAILILVLAWTFSTVCGSDYLNFTGYVVNLINSFNISCNLIPFILFIATFILTLCVGVSWTAIALMVPIATVLFNDTETPLLILTIAAVISGGAAGDHIGPISDTTILSARIAGADLLEHIISQFQYGIIVVIIAALGYLIAGVVGLYWLGLLFGTASVILVLCFIKKMQGVKSIGKNK